jgi:thiamine-phosphate pyrophosphorylase
MARGYSVRVPTNQTLPQLWLLSDQRNDAVLEDALMRLPRGSGFIYRHYHLPPAERVARYWQVERIARARDHTVILADSALTAREWGADGTYGAPLSLVPRRADMLMLATAHDMAEIAAANRARADAVLLSPAFATASHPEEPALSPVRFRTIARYAQMPVIALGGMTQRHADRLQWPRWAAIDGLS